MAPQQTLLRLLAVASPCPKPSAPALRRERPPTRRLGCFWLPPFTHQPSSSQKKKSMRDFSRKYTFLFYCACVRPPVHLVKCCQRRRRFISEVVRTTGRSRYVQSSANERLGSELDEDKAAHGWPTLVVLWLYFGFSGDAWNPLPWRMHNTHTALHTGALVGCGRQLPRKGRTVNPTV